MLQHLTRIIIVLSLLDASLAKSVKISDLDSAIDELEQEKSLLPELKVNSLPSGVYSYLMQTNSLRKDQKIHWVQLDLKSEVTPTLIAMVPDYRPSGELAGFPVYFTISLSNHEDGRDEKIISEYRTEAFQFDKSAVPMFRNPEGYSGRYLRLTIHLPPGADPNPPYHDKIVCRLSELMVLRNETNLALGAAVTTSLVEMEIYKSAASNLVDGWSQLNLPEDPSKKSSCEGYHSWHSGGEKVPDEPYWVGVDLGSEMPIDQINLIPVTPRTFISADGYGFPEKFIIEVAKNADFSDATTVLDYSEGGFPNPGSRMYSLRCGGEMARFVRMKVLELMAYPWGSMMFCISELEVISKGENVSRSKAVIAYNSLEDPHIPTIAARLSENSDYDKKSQAEKDLMIELYFRERLAQGNIDWVKYALVDGYSGAHKLLPVPEWLEGLERRALLTQRIKKLQVLRDALLAQQVQRAKQSLYLGLAVAAVILIILVCFFYYRNKLVQRRIRAQLSQDLHDDLGSDLSNIALLSQMISKDIVGDENPTASHTEALHHAASKSIDSLRNIVFLTHQNARPLKEIEQRLRSAAEVQLDPLGIEFSFRANFGDKVRDDIEMPGNVIRDIMLVCKEALNNISKHAKASQVEMTIDFSRKAMTVIISDNGNGFTPNTPSRDGGVGMSSMKARIEKHRGEFRVLSEENLGTTINFSLPLNQ